LNYRLGRELNLSRTNRNSCYNKPEIEKTYDHLIIEQNNDISTQETSVRTVSKNANRGLNRSQRITSIFDNRLKNSRDNRRESKRDEREKPFHLKDYNSKNEEILILKSGGLGPNIGGKQWQEEKAKRDRIKDFTSRMSTFKKYKRVMNRDL
jgi:hypothetical protein